MAIPERFLDEVIARTDLVDLVSESVRLTKKGSSYWGCCPFHSEKTPSFHVVPDRQIYKCFGCGKGGGAINFVMELENLSFREAVEVLAKRAGMQMPESVGPSADARQRREKLLELNRQAARAFHSWLYSPEGAQGLSYLQKRGLSKATLTRFGLGFAPNSWDALIRELGKQGYDKRDLLDAGLAVNNKDGRIYDRFRNRVMFPIIDVRGNVIGFGGRVMDDSTPKYLNSPDTPVYNKSRNIFALNIAKKTKADRVILTEGYMDTISLHQAGFDSAVASLGTALTEEHAQLLSRYFKQAIISYDGDGAGVAAAQRAIPILEKAGLKVRVLRVTGAKDPDEFIKKYGRDAFARLLDKSENQVDYRLDQLRQKFDLEDDTQKVAFLQEAAQMLAGLHSAVEREIYGGHAAQTAGVSPETMAQEINRALKVRLRREKKQQERRDLSPASQMQPRSRGLRYENIRSARAEEGVLRLLLLDPDLLREAQGLTGAEFSSPLLGRAYDRLKARAEEGLSLHLAALAEEFTGDEMDHLAQVAAQPESAANARQAMADYIAVIRREALLRSSAGSGDDLLRAAQRRYQEKKAYMEEKP
ncbi:DNA primase [Pseudoflavonifractor sp. AF19-9AC]|uniref:DNA primase n=1 Tax=Pseudoflavonifractor sp. AF19-9AC TaxID=2292244 RepID=UPI000E519F11|nr:DNA primase [Pseudoflavonifractor sp. AF19-9AC]RHR11189.1 DNA primase [Pseudoflavonifractor sp. AF19-9AC]